MLRKQVLTVIVLVTVFSWSVVMAAFGQIAAVATLVPSLGLLVQQLVKVLAGSTEQGRVAGPPSATDGDEGCAR
jgi:hypothetical protein